MNSLLLAHCSDQSAEGYNHSAVHLFMLVGWPLFQDWPMSQFDVKKKRKEKKKKKSIIRLSHVKSIPKDSLEKVRFGSVVTVLVF